MRKFDDILKNMNVEFHEKKLKQYGITITDEDIDNYAYNFGFEAKARRSAVMNIHEKKNDY